MCWGEKRVTYCLDCQGGKGSANFQRDVCATILSDSHGTPHAVAIPYMRKKTKSEHLCSNIPFTVQTCDGGSHRRKDRLNGGMYITKGIVSMALSTMQPQETLIVRKTRNKKSHLNPQCEK